MYSSFMELYGGLTNDVMALTVHMRKGGESPCLNGVDIEEIQLSS